jgi:hypothetical protein
MVFSLRHTPTRPETEWIPTSDFIWDDFFDADVDDRLSSSRHDPVDRMG